MAEEDEAEYVSDPEDAKLMRRRVASDDEEEKEGVESKNREEKRIIDESDAESEGGAADYEEDELEEDYDLDEYVEEEEYGKYDERVGRGVEIAVEVGRDDAVVVVAESAEEKKGVKSGSNDGGEFKEESSSVLGEEKKEVEPFAVPTAGAFYMHDDRFRDNAVGRQRRMLGGRKLWESKDDRKWGHDKFEELTVQERHHGERRRGSRGRNRGRGRHRGTDRGYVRGDRPREYSNNSTQNHENQNNAPKAVRGRGPRRYQPSFKNDNAMLLSQNKQSGKPVAKPSHINSARVSGSVINTETNEIPPRKQVSASSLNIASPPFYPSGSSAKDDINLHKRDVQAGRVYRNGQPSVVDENLTMAQSTAMMRGKNIADSMGMNKLYIDDSLSTMAGKSSNSLQMPQSGSSSNNPTQAQFRGQGRGVTSSTPMAYKSTVSYNQVNRAPLPSQFSTGQKNPVQSRAQSYVQASGQQFRRAPSGAKASSPTEASGAVNAFESGGTESSSESSKSNVALVAKGKDSMQGNERGSFIYGGNQVMGVSGNMASGHGDQNFPTFLPVMQFGGQHPGGIGVPAVGMAFPGYVGQPQHGGPRNSEMTWLPVLAGAAGGLGPNFCPPYINVDGSYQVRPPGSASLAAGSSKESNATKVGNDSNPAQRPEPANDDFGQRQKNPRRYTEMKFDH